jgi:two-component system response regulator YesN
MKDIEDYIRFQSTTQGGQHWLIMKAVNYIKENYASDLKASEVANVINVSPNYFSQLIKQETGTHFNDYLHDVRLNQAKVLLKETPFRVFEIAEMVGYKDYKYFVHIFKKSTTITPTKYRKIVTDFNGES